MIFYLSINNCKKYSTVFTKSQIIYIAIYQFIRQQKLQKISQFFENSYKFCCLIMKLLEVKNRPEIKPLISIHNHIQIRYFLKLLWHSFKANLIYLITQSLPINFICFQFNCICYQDTLIPSFKLFLDLIANVNQQCKLIKIA